MKNNTTVLLLILLVLATSSSVLLSFTVAEPMVSPKHTCDDKPIEGCVFKTVFEGEGVDKEFRMAIPSKVQQANKRGLDWLVKAQQKDGGFGAGAHAMQHERNPHSVKADPATTAMVAMAILRAGSTLEEGHYSEQLNGATEFLLLSVENAPTEAPNITELTGTQIQTKLGAFIDVALTSQYLSNLLEVISEQHSMHQRVFDAMQVCVEKIERNQGGDGSTKGAGWAGVLQSSFATNALEAAEVKGARVNRKALQEARDYQMSNINVASGSIATESAAGVMLYSVSSSSRASAKEARKAKRAIERAAEQGLVEEDAEVTQENLQKAGMSLDDAMKSTVSFEVYETSKVRAQESDVVRGFGNNGGEEFLSFLQTGEALIVNEDMEWQNWYTNTSERLLAIQNNDGSWNGHHCITSPVFCTATSLLILSVNNDIDQLVAQGAE
jgi:hypothetical protein